jgi:acylphosphatase
MNAHILVLGFVQGVGFRRFIAKKARDLGLLGWVRNLPDGRVEILAQGEKSNIKALIEITEKGNIFSDVKDVVVNYVEEKEKLEGFEIR